MRRTWWWVAAAVLGVIAVLRQHREARGVRSGELTQLGPSGSVDTGRDQGRLHRHVATWTPPRPASRLGRAVAALWASPMTAVGLAGGLLGGRLPRWDHTQGIAVVTTVRGPVRWFLRAQGASAATLGQVVVLRDAEAAPALLTHEAAHARQQERLGPLFAVAYPVATALWGYRRNPFEVAARAAARGPEQPSRALPSGP